MVASNFVGDRAQFRRSAWLFANERLIGDHFNRPRRNLRRETPPWQERADTGNSDQGNNYGEGDNNRGNEDQAATLLWRRKRRALAGANLPSGSRAALRYSPQSRPSPCVRNLAHA